MAWDTFDWVTVVQGTNILVLIATFDYDKITNHSHFAVNLPYSAVTFNTKLGTRINLTEDMKNKSMFKTEKKTMICRAMLTSTAL